MWTNYTERLFYVVKESDTTYSLYSIQTDHLILAGVAANAISDFLLLNEPNNPALSHLETTSNYFYDSNPNSKWAVNYYTPFSTYESYDAYDSTEITQWRINSLKDYNLDNADKQLSFSFSSDLDEKYETNLTNFVTNLSNFYVVTDKTDSSKDQYDPESEWKDLILDDD